MLRLLIALVAFLVTPAAASADLVQFAPMHARQGAELARRAGGTEIARELRLWNIPSRAVADLRRAGIVQLARPDRLLRAQVVSVQPSDPLVPTEWWRTVIGADRVEAPGPGTPITVVDSGLDVNHPEFSGRPNTTALNPQTTKEDDEDHGTEVSSVVAAPNNGVGVVGVYPDSVLRVWDASPFGFLSESEAIRGIVEAARRGPGVINLSFGGEEDDPLLQEAIGHAFRSGSLVVAAAGNEGLEGSPANFPALYPHVLTVGATNQSGRVAAFSTISRTVDLVAPGVGIPVAEPLANDPSGYAVASGTSFASPLVAGAAAWVWTTRPSLDNTQLFELMRRSARDLGEAGFDNASGWGLLDLPAALSFHTPMRDPQEPNEHPNEIEPNAVFANGTTPLTRPGHNAGSIVAHVDRSEDPLDLYRVWSPASRTVRARVTGAVMLRVLARSNKRRVLAVARRGRAAYRNHATRGLYVYVEVRPLRVRETGYKLRVTVARP